MSEYAPIVKTRYTVQMWEGARRVRVSVGREASGVDGSTRTSTQKRRGGKRGSVRGFSGQSVARLRDFYDTLRPQEVARGWHITLTYPEGLGLAPSQVRAHHFTEHVQITLNWWVLGRLRHRTSTW